MPCATSRDVARASSRDQFGTPVWSSTTRISWRSRASRCIVVRKFFPRRP